MTTPSGALFETAPYVIGVDFGTLSGRAVLADARNGDELAEAVCPYSHGVLDRALPSGTPLPANFALQHPADYTEVLRRTIPEVLKQAGVSPKSVAGIGLDFTACTLLPVDCDGTPLCLKEEWANEPHAWVKLWKHHAAQPEADEINRLAAARGEAWLERYGGKLSCEWALPKILEVLRHAPAVYAATDRFTEAGEWLTRILTGTETHSATFAGYKACWSFDGGYPSNDFFRALDPALDGIVGTKLSTAVLPIGKPAGTLSQVGADLTGLPVGLPVALPVIDGHAAMPAMHITGKNELMLVLGTSSAQMVNDTRRLTIPGICGFVENGVIPGLCTYEAGQACVGDGFDWFVRNCVPAAVSAEAEAQGKNLHAYLREKAERLRPGESGLIALDWLNGNRNILGDANLRAAMFGMTLATRPEEIYRAWIESTAYGARVILERMVEYGLRIDGICAGGGIAQKDPMLMQIYADVLNRPIRVAATRQAGALGSAMYASVAGGLWADICTASDHMAKPDLAVYHPIAENVTIYNDLFRQYRRLHDLFASGFPQRDVTFREETR